MDLFRKNKKKQNDESITNNNAVLSVTDALDRIAVTAAEDENDGIHANDGCHQRVASPDTGRGNRSSAYNTSSNTRRSQANSSRIGSTGIDALIDSDDDGAEIFTDGDSEEDPGNVSMVSENSHRSPAVIEKVSLSPRQRGQVLNSSFGTGRSSNHQNDADVEASRARLSNSHQNDDDDDAEEISSSGDDGTTSDEVDDHDDDKSHSDSAEDYTDDEDEGEDGYKPGGYHVVKVGEVFNQR